MTPLRTEIIISATRPQNVLGEKGQRIRELTAVVQKRYARVVGCLCTRVFLYVTWPFPPHVARHEVSTTTWLRALQSLSIICQHHPGLAVFCCLAFVMECCWPLHVGSMCVVPKNVTRQLVTDSASRMTPSSCTRSESPSVACARRLR